MSLQTLIERLGAKRRGREWRSRCPNCNAGQSAVSIEEKDGRIVIHCFSCQDTPAILSAIGMTWKELLGGAVTSEYEPVSREEDDRVKDEAARDAIQLWGSASQCDHHPYLERKRVPSFGLRVHKDMLLIPMYDSRGIRNVQRIFPSGEKRFMPNAQVHGCHYIIEGDDHTMIGEGYATCATAAMATKYRVVVAFNAGNMPKVAERFKFAHALADNDAGTEKKIGKNPGIEAAAASAKITGGIVLVPPKLHGVTDWNDAAQIIGIKAVGSRIIGEINRACGSVRKNP